MSGFGGFSFGNTPTTTAATTFGSTAATTFGTATNQQQQQQTAALPTFASTQNTALPATGFGATSAFGTQPATGASGGLFSLGGQQTQQSTSGFAFNFANQAAKPATTQAQQQPQTGFGGTSLFGATSTIPTSAATNQLASNQLTTAGSSFLGATATQQQTPSTTAASTFSLTSTAPAPQQQQQITSTSLGSTTPGQTTNQPLLLGSTQTTQSALNASANKPTTAATGGGGGFQLNFSSGGQPPSSLTTTSGLTATTTTATQQATTSLSTPSMAATQQQTVQQPTQMTFKQLEGYINVWLNELNQMEGDFQKQSQTINSWDSLLVNNALKITNINENLDLLKEEHKRIDQQLDFVISQQNELEQLLEPLEKIQVDFNVNDTASTEREFTYSLVDTVSNDLQGIGTELQNFIKKLNETKANQDLNDPLSSIGKILNSHIDALQYIEHQISVLKRNAEA